ncbi:MAG TPA: hypothetical protein VFN61_09150 [Acidimicrobiales bacterium]|nr:hypothetical protein [Acidimicrobiales bacterium]
MANTSSCAASLALGASQVLDRLGITIAATVTNVVTKPQALHTGS